jgi:hypothetical protein
MAGKPPRSKAGMYSRRSAMRRLDGRTRQGRLARDLERDLVDHLGGLERVTVAHRLLIKSTCILALRLQLAAERMAEGADGGDHYARELVAVANGIRLNCITLGMARPAEVPSLQRYLEGKAEARRVA